MSAHSEDFQRAVDGERSEHSFEEVKDTPGQATASAGAGASSQAGDARTISVRELRYVVKEVFSEITGSTWSWASKAWREGWWRDGEWGEYG